MHGWSIRNLFLISEMLANLPIEVLIQIAGLLPLVLRSRTFPRLSRLMYSAEILSWECQISRSTKLFGWEAKKASIQRFMSLHEDIRQAIIRNSHTIPLENIYISSVYSVMAHTILGKAVEQAAMEDAKFEPLLRELVFLSDRVISRRPSPPDSRSQTVLKFPARRCCSKQHSIMTGEDNRFRVIVMMVQRIIDSELDHPGHKILPLSAFQDDVQTSRMRLEQDQMMVQCDQTAD